MLKIRKALSEQEREHQRIDMSSSDENINQQLSGSLTSVSACVSQTHLPKTASPAKVAANRRNAQKSSGPKTAEGKSRSRWNAMKHGVLSKRLAVIDAKGSSAYLNLLASLREEQQPQGALEEIQIEKIAMDYWRLHVAYGHEFDFARSAECFLTTIDRVGRYATSIHRQLKEDVNQLDRLQRQRNGDFVPPPVSIDLNVNGPEPDAEVDPLQDVEQSPETSVMSVSAGSEDLKHLSCPETAAADETAEGKGHPLQCDGMRAEESAFSGIASTKTSILSLIRS